MLALVGGSGLDRGSGIDHRVRGSAEDIDTGYMHIALHRHLLTGFQHIDDGRFEPAAAIWPEQVDHGTTGRQDDRQRFGVIHIEPFDAHVGGAQPVRFGTVNRIDDFGVTKCTA
ncbi:hypothetical protein D3C81_1784570 [compost metagenome]